MNIRKWTLLFLAVACITCALLQGAAPDSQDPAFSKRIYFSALNKEEKPVLGLKPGDFELHIDGKPTPIVSFHAGLRPNDRSIPLVALLLLSFGPTMKSKVIEAQANAVAGIFQMVDTNSAVGVKLVSDRSETLAPLAHNPAELRGAFLQYEQRRAELNVGLKKGTEVVGNAGMVRALELAIEEVQRFVDSQEKLKGREVHKAVMLISSAELNPGYSLKTVYDKSAEYDVFVYPVYYPLSSYGAFVGDYFEVAKKTAGVASVFGALMPGSQVLPLPRYNLYENALNANFTHMIRDLNGKYSFTIPARDSVNGPKIDLKCKVKGVQIRMPRKN